MRLSWSLLLGLCAFAAAGCHSNPYCLNCGKEGGDLAPTFFDLSHPVDLGPPDLTTPPDLTVTGDGGPCVPTNGGIEICDGIDNDCNGKIDDVSPDKLVGDPNNCGACGNVCNFNAQHQFGACTGGFDGGTPTCVPTTCQPGWVMLPGHTTCDYQCTPTSDPTEICDGKDNDCNGHIDDPFTNGWDATGKPLYNKDVNNCGGCGSVCSLPGAVATCKSDPTTGVGFCGVDHCINDGTNTYRHDPSKGNIDSTGCEYHCPFPSTTVTTGSQDCDNTTCSFPAEVCNGIDDNCDFQIDNPPFDPADGIGSACGATCPGGLVANCKGACKAGTVMCSGGVKQCVSPAGSGPSAETCDGIDNDCNGLVDDPFTAPAPGGYADGNAGQMPLYNSDPKNCGACGGGCALQHAVNGCEPDGTNGNKGMCYVIQCDAGFYYATVQPKAGDPPGTCSGAAPGPENGPTGVGCYYACAGNPGVPEVCNGVDDDCNGCVDDGLTAPDICSHLGQCGLVSPPLKPTCQGAGGWKCDYSKVPDVNLNGTNLATLETLCDNEDNNCNGVIDKDGFPTLGQSCSVGIGACQNSGTIACDLNASDPSYKKSACMSSNVLVTASSFKARDESCNGKDDDCDGQIDERVPTSGSTCYTDDSGGGAHACLGWIDPMVQVGSQWVYQYESSRPDATSTSQGGNSARACSSAGVIPWSDVTEAQAQAACAAVKDSAGNPMHLCDETTWQNACEGPGGPYSNSYSYSSANTTYVAGVCNDQSAGKGAVWTTGFDNGLAEKCYTPWTGGNLHDMSGNVMEWTNSTLTVGGTTYNKIRGGAYTSFSDGTPPDGTSCEFDFVIAQPTFANADIGFRCCADNAP